MFTSWLRAPKLFFVSIPKTQVVVNTPDLISLFLVRRCRESRTRQRCMQYVIRKPKYIRYGVIIPFFFIQEGGRSYPSGNTTKQTLFLMICRNLNLISRCTVWTLYKGKLTKNILFVCHVVIFTFHETNKSCPNFQRNSFFKTSSKNLKKVLNINVYWVCPSLG